MRALWRSNGGGATTAFGRLHADQHWSSDVVFGAIIASVIGHATVTSDDGSDSAPDDGMSLGLRPTADGIALTWRWQFGRGD